MVLLSDISEVSDVPASSELLADIGWVEYIDLDRWVIEDLNDYRSLTHSSSFTQEEIIIWIRLKTVNV